jgi:Ca2+-binding EF-hand superfamily protein
MKTTSILIATSLLLAAGVRAQTTTTTPRQFGTGELPEFLEAYDLDGDGKLSVEERQAFEKAMREARPGLPGGPSRWDTDGDGKLSPEEIQAAREAIAAKIREIRVKRFNELDVNDDGQLSAEELKAIPGITDEMIVRMIAHLDKNADGTISLEEFLAVLRPIIPPFPLPQPLPNPYPEGGIPCPPPLARFDLDRNGKLSLAEAQAAINAIDTDDNGTVSPAEWDAYLKCLSIPPFPLPQPLPDPYPLTGISCPPPLASFDLDKNGRLSLAEAQAVIAALDKDGDGKVSPAEWDAYLKTLLPPFPLPQPLPNPYPLNGLACPLSLASFDVDKNTRLSLVEAQSAIAAIDTDSNGTVSPAEWDAYRKAHTTP